MSITYTNWENGALLLDVRNNINNWGTTVQDAVNQNETNITNTLGQATAYTDAKVSQVLQGDVDFSGFNYIADNPVLNLGFSGTSTFAGLDIKDTPTSNLITSFTYDKASNSVGFVLNNPSTDTQLNSLTMNPDGNLSAPFASAPTLDEHLTTKKYVDELHHYAFNKVAGASTTSDTYTQLNALTVPASIVPDNSTWELKFSMTYNLNTTNRSAYLRFSIDGGTSWNEFRRESKDITDNVTAYYAFPINYITSQDIELIVEYRTEQNGDVLNIAFIDIMAERKV